MEPCLLQCSPLTLRVITQKVANLLVYQLFIRSNLMTESFTDSSELWRIDEHAGENTAITPIEKEIDNRDDGGKND